MKAAMFLALKYDRLQLRLDEVCAEIGVDVRTARSQINAGTFPIPTIKANEHVMADARDVAQYIEGCREAAQRGRPVKKGSAASTTGETQLGGQMAQYDSLISKLAEELAKHIRPQFPIEIALWDLETVAAYLRRSHAVVRSRIVCLPDFPKAIRPPSTRSERGFPLYEAKEVIAWAKKYKDKN